MEKPPSGWLRPAGGRVGVIREGRKGDRTDSVLQGPLIPA